MIKTISSRDRLKTLHWLPVSSLIDYKVCLLSFKAMTLSKPDYLTSLLSVYTPTCELRSGSDGVRLIVPRTDLAISSRAFSVYAPNVWNSLPQSVGKLASGSNPSSLSCFKTSLKTHLFSAFDPE